MTTGKTEGSEETCGHQSKEETSSRAAFTTLSTVAIQAGLTQIVASVLKSGSLIHLQLVQFQPGLCEIGSNQEENVILIQEQQQLLEKLQKHEPDVLAVVEKKQQERLIMRKDGRRKQKEEAELTEAMKASLSEGWSLLLRLLRRRLEVLKLASDFFCRVIEFSVGIDRFENVQIKADEDKLKDVWVSYEIIKKDLLGKSLRVLTSSSVLHQKLRQLQRAEALQSRGSVLQEDEEEVEESFQCSREPMLKLEELVEGLQDRRRVADQTLRLQLQEAEVVLKMREKSKKALAELLSASQDQSLLNLNLQSGSTVDLHSKSWSEQKPINQTEELNLEPGVTSQKSGYEPGSWLDLNSHARLNLTRDLKSGSTVEEIKDEQEDVQRGTRSNEKLISASAKPNFRSGETTETIVESEWVSQKSALHYQRGSVKTQTLVSESSSAESTDLKTEPVSQKSKDLQSDFRSDIKTRSEAPSSESKQSNDIRLSSESEKTKKPQPEPVETREPLFSFRSVLKNRFSLNELYITELEDVCPGPAKTRKLLSDSSSTERTHLQTRVCLAKETKPESQNSKDSQTGFRSDPNNRNKSELPGSKEGENLKLPSRSVKTSKQQLESPPVDTSDSLTDPAPVLKTRSGSHEPPGFTFTDTKSQQLESRSEKIQTESTGSRPEGVKNQKLGINSQNITETMKSGSVDKSRSTSEKTRGQKSESRPAEITDLQTGSRLDLKHQSRSDVPGSGSQEGKNRSSISRKNSEGPKTVASTVYNFVFSSDLKARSGSDEQQTCQTEVKPTSGSEPTKAQRTGYGSEVPGSQSDPLPLKQHIDGIKQGLNQRQMDVQENQTFCSGSQERLVKTLQDLKSVSELLDLSTRMDLGSELLTSRLLEHFRQAEPHFRQLNAEVENTVRSWESLRGAQLKEKHLSELLKIQQAVKEKIQRSESALNLSNSFHVTAKQLELLLESEPSSPLVGSPGLHGSTEAELSRLQEARQQVQNLLKTASTLRTDICSAVSQSTSAGFQVEQLEVRLKTLDSVCERWLSKAAQCEEELRKQQLTHLLQEDITQLRDSFKELKKRFSNTKFNYLKRNDRTRNLKAVLNQLQQMEVYQEKLQGLRKRVYGSMARLGSEVKNTGVARQLEDAVNELQRQMGQLDKNICEHQKTLNMTCRLQQAIEEYQFWCEEASATIARVGKFSLECRSTEAVSFLHRQFEKFVWPTVPQQEERISQITELAIKLHGVDEGQRYIEKMVSKHSDMVESIRELSNSLMELEAKLKLENLKQQQKDEEKEEGEREHGRQTEEKMKDKRPINPRDNRSMQEDADMHELKETGHTPELIPENDRKEAGAANRKSPVEKSQLLNGPTVERELLSGKITSSFTSTLTSCSPMDAKRKDQATHKQPQPQATPSQSVIGPSFHDNQGEFDFEMEGAVQQRTSSFCGSNSNLLQDNSPYMELHQPEVAIEDFLSNDEYECTSPDDISLPPLAETPESNMLQSDIEEGFCFSSHSVHISQVSHQCQPQSEAAGKDPVLQEKESCQQKGSGLTESGPLPTLSVHSSTRIRSESRSFNPSPSTVAVTTLFTSSLCTILKTKESNSDISVETPVHEYNTQDGSKDKNFQSLHSQSCNSSDIGFHNCSNTKGDTGVQNLNLSYTKINSILHEHRPESHHGTTIQTNQKIKSVNNSRGATYKEDIFKTSTSLVSNQNIYIQSSIPGYHCTKPKICSNLPCDPANQSSTTPQDLKPSKKSTNTRYGIEQDTPSIIRGSNHGTTTTINEQSVFNQSFLPGISQTDRTSNQDPINPPKSNSSCCSKQSLRTVYPFQKPLTPTQTQKSVHDPSMNPSSAQPAAPHPKPQSNTSSHQANLHGTSSCSPRVLTPSQDPDICPPMAICEEIKLTPQIQGLPLPPAHLRQTPSESLPLGKASESSLPLFTRPRSQATVMEGSPVTLEVEVMGNPEPRLTWSEREEESPCCSDQNQDQESLRSVGISSQRAADKWLVLEALDIMMEDWDAWFGTLCVLLWLVYLILL